MPGYRSPFNRAAAAARAAAAEPRDMDLFLMRALVHDDINVAIDMVGHGANVNYRNKLGETPLMAAALKGNVTMVQMLLEKGADVNAADAQGNTALHWLARSDWTREIPGLAQLMMDSGADSGITNAQGETAGYIAGRLNKDRLARLLDSGIPGVRERKETIEVSKPIRFKTAPPPAPEPEPEPVAAEPASPPPAKVEKTETIREMEKRFAKAGLFG